METSQLICVANQLTGFYIRATLAFNGLIKVARALNGDLNQFAESHWIIDATQKFVLKI